MRSPSSLSAPLKKPASARPRDGTTKKDRELSRLVFFYSGAKNLHARQIDVKVDGATRIRVEVPTKRFLSAASATSAPAVT